MTTEQLSLINSLMYYDGLMLKEDMTLGECIQEMKEKDPDGYEKMIKKSPGLVGEENAEKIIEAILKDEELSNLEIYKSTRDEAYSGAPVMACFVDPDSKEALVAYRGTNDTEWIDNAEGFYKESSLLQRDALRFFDECADELSEEGYEIDVTGHSKGGNKAQYVTIMDERVRNCYSFNGQGFSNEFCEENADLIEERSDKITAYAASDDYVHCLGNQIAGTNIWFETNRIDLNVTIDNKLVNGLVDIDNVFDVISDASSIALSHAPNAYFQIDDNGNVKMNECTSQSEHSAEINRLTEEMMDKPDDVKEEYFRGMMGIAQIALGAGEKPICEEGMPSLREIFEGSKEALQYMLDNWEVETKDSDIWKCSLRESSPEYIMGAQSRQGVYLNRIPENQIQYKMIENGTTQSQIAMCGFPDKESATGISYFGTKADCVFPSRDKNGNQLVAPLINQTNGERKDAHLYNVRIGDAGSMKPIIRPMIGEDGKLTNQRIDMPVEKIRESCEAARNISKEESVQKDNQKTIQAVLQESERVAPQTSIDEAQCIA